jgi:hypothetical protein
MANSVLQDKNGPDWPLGFIKVVTPGTPVSIMSLVDASSLNDPGKATASGVGEYTSRCQQLQFQAVKPAANGFQNNTGNIYIVRTGDSTGSANRNDQGAIVAVLQPGQTYVLASAPLNRNVFNMYRYRIDADNANDGALVTAIIQ